MITSEVYARTFRFVGESNRPGAAFLAEVGDGLYLITAAHNCSGDREEEVRIQQAHQGTGLKRITLERVGALNHPVAAYRFPDEARPEWFLGSVLLSDANVTFGQDCYIVGYPYNLSTSLVPESSPVQMEIPIIKKGVISGMRTSPEGHRQWIIDAIANPGFSGGPLALKTVVGEPEWRCAGVVLQAMTAPMEEGGEMYAAGLSVCVAAIEVTNLIDGG